MDFRAVLYALGFGLLAIALFVKIAAFPILGVALMAAAIIYGWRKNQLAMRSKVRDARRRNPELHRSRRSYYIV